MNRKEAERITHQENTLMSLGFTKEEAESLRRISMTLHRWHELECGMDNGCIERDEQTGKAYWLDSQTMRRSKIADRETGAKRRLAAIIGQRNGRPAIKDGRLNANPNGPVSAYIQTDPRGSALYILRPGDVPEGESAESFYNRGIAVY